MVPVWIFAPQSNSRLQYVLEEIFHYRFKGDFRLVSDLETYRTWDGPKICYTPRRTFGNGVEIWIPACSLLFESGISAPLPEVKLSDGLPAFFFADEAVDGADFSFDLFALVFFQLSRYEEYLHTDFDRHGRFPASASLAAQRNFLEIPIVDAWLSKLAGKMTERFPALEIKPPAFSFLPTFDIDQAWAFRHKPIWRLLGGGAKALASGRLREALQRLAVGLGREQDPFDAFSLIQQLHDERNLHPLFFFLLADAGPYDKNNPPANPALQKLIRELAGRASIGIHPSYNSLEEPSLVAKEKQRLERISGQSILKSRQHYLRLRLPDSYRALLDAGIEEDYSMGFADAVGFRAGTSVPFHWYDLASESATTLRIVPFQAMDVTLRQYLGLGPEEALERLTQLSHTVSRYGGQFCTLWHNSSYDEKGDWKGWTAVYIRILKEATFFLPLRKDET